MFAKQKGVCEKPGVQEQVIISLSTQTERCSIICTHVYTRMHTPRPDNISEMQSKQEHMHLNLFSIKAPLTVDKLYSMKAAFHFVIRLFDWLLDFDRF